jgi:hypothetical protein
MFKETHAPIPAQERQQHQALESITAIVICCRAVDFGPAMRHVHENLVYGHPI